MSIMNEDPNRAQEPTTPSQQGMSRGLVAIGEIGRFKPTQPGKIHLRCRRCKATRSNMPREQFDPVNAVVMALSYCPRCDKGGEFEETTYYDANGKEITDC